MPEDHPLLDQIVEALLAKLEADESFEGIELPRLRQLFAGGAGTEEALRLLLREGTIGHESEPPSH